MASILRQLVAGPRARHPEANLDLCYVTDEIIATSGPSSTYPSLAYRNPLDQLVKFLDSKHGGNWSIWEFRAEGCGYSDDDVYGRIRHYPWPDHHPPPFVLLPKIIATMKEWMEAPGTVSSIGEESTNKRVIVVHCKAGKGRSGTSAISYLISEKGWGKDDALKRFTERRMRPGFGNGISIPSQLRWINYVERWAGVGGKRYVDHKVEILEVHLWGLRDGVKVAVEGFVESGKKTECFHVFDTTERDETGLAGAEAQGSGFAAVAAEAMGRKTAQDNVVPQDSDQALGGTDTPTSNSSDAAALLTNTIYRPKRSIVVPTSDVNLAIERRNKGAYGWTMVTSVAHVWFNCYFEGNGPERYKSWIESQPASPETELEQIPEVAMPEQSGVFSLAWEAMDGIKGSSRKGQKCFDKVAVLWRIVTEDGPAKLPETQITAAAPIESADTGLRPERADSALVDKQSPDGHKRLTVEMATSLEEGDSDEDGAQGIKTGVTGVDESRG